MVATSGDVLLQVSNPPPIVAIINQLYKNLTIDLFTYCHVVPILQSNSKPGYMEQNNAFRKSNRSMVKLHNQSCLEFSMETSHSQVHSAVLSTLQNSRVLLSQGP